MGHKISTQISSSEMSPNNNLPLAKIESSISSKPDAAAAFTYSKIKVECEQALTALRGGNHTKAFHLMEECYAKIGDNSHDAAALIHRVQGAIYLNLASKIDEPKAKQLQLKKAIESARKATELSPNSIEFSYFYANLLYEAANKGKDYEEVMKECDRGLEIQNPIDPAKESESLSLGDKKLQKRMCAKARIFQLQGELKILRKISSISNLVPHKKINNYINYG